MSAPIVPPKVMIEMRGVAVTAMKRPDTTVVRDINWTVRAGEFWVVGAPQHSGKSDFLMTVGGILAPAAGEYIFAGEPMPIFDDERMAHRLKLGFVFDGGQLLGHLSVAENIALPLRYHAKLPPAMVEARVQELLALTELVPLANNTPANVGRSWQQRAGLARALALAPEVLLLDSPLTGLDMRHAAWWLALLRELSRGHRIVGAKPLTIVATADDLRPWRAATNRVAVLAQQRFQSWSDWATAAAAENQILRELL